MVNVAPYISAYVGTPPNPSYRRCSRLLWRLGPAHLIEEPLSGSTANEMYRLGPNYVGSFQAPCLEGQVRVVSWILRGLVNAADCQYLNMPCRSFMYIVPLAPNAHNP